MVGESYASAASDATNMAVAVEGATSARHSENLVKRGRRTIARRPLCLSRCSSGFFGGFAANDRQSVLVGIESFFPIQALQEFPRCFADRRRHGTGIDLDCSSLRAIRAVLVFQFHCIHGLFPSAYRITEHLLWRFIFPATALITGCLPGSNQTAQLW